MALEVLSLLCKYENSPDYLEISFDSDFLFE